MPLTFEEAAACRPEEMERSELVALLPRLEALYSVMSEDMPDETDPEAFEARAEQLEVLDDLMDDIHDLLEEEP